MTTNYNIGTVNFSIPANVTGLTGGTGGTIIIDNGSGGLTTVAPGGADQFLLSTAGSAAYSSASTAASKLNHSDLGVIGDGSDHTFIDQDVTVSATPTFNEVIVTTTTPSGSNRLTSKSYVDSVATGSALDVKQSVVAASTVDLDSNGSISGVATYNNTGGSSGRGQITATLAVSDTFTIDGVTFGSADDGSRILLKDQTSGDENGIWTTTVSGTSLTLNRADDFDEDSEVTAGAFTFVTEGTTHADQGWLLTTNDPITIGGASGTSLTFAQFSGEGGVAGSDGEVQYNNSGSHGASSNFTFDKVDTLNVPIIGHGTSATQFTILGQNYTGTGEGLLIGDMAAQTSPGTSVALGATSIAGDALGIAIGNTSSASGSRSIAIGDGMSNAIADSTLLLGGHLIRNTSTGAQATAQRFWASSKTVYATQIINLTVVGPTNYDIIVPTSASFLLDEITVQQVTGGTADATLHFEDNTTSDKYFPAFSQGNDTAGSVNKLIGLDSNESPSGNTLRVRVEGVANAGTCRIYWIGILVQNE